MELFSLTESLNLNSRNLELIFSFKSDITQSNSANESIINPCPLGRRTGVLLTTTELALPW